MWHSEQVKFVNYKYDVWNCVSSPGMKNLDIFGHEIAFWSQNCNVPDFYKIWQREQIEHANYEYINWNWWPWPKITNFRNLILKTERCFNFYEVWHLQQIEHAIYEYSTWNWWSWPKIIKLFEIQNLTQNFRFGQIWSHASNIILFLNLVFRAERIC